MKRLAVIMCLLAVSAGVYAQDQFEGKIKYAIDYVQLPAEMEDFKSMLPTEMSLSYKGMKSRLEQDVAGMGSQVVITDYSNNMAIVMMDMLGEKIAIMTSEEEMKAMEEMNSDMTIDIRKKDNKKIAGYKCKKAIITSASSEAPITVYFTDKFSIAGSQFKGLEGLPLEYTQNQGDMQLRLTATEISEEQLDDNLFEVSEEYEQMTTEELQKKFGALDVDEVED